MKPLISYVTFNRMGSTVKSLLSLLNTREDFDLYITDNDSKDKTWDWLNSLKDPRIKKINKSEKNYGALNATNWALSHRLRGQDFINFEADTIIDNPDFIEDFRKLFKEFPEIGIASGYIEGLYAWGGFKIDSQIKNGVQADVTPGVYGFLYMIPGKVMDKLGFYNEASYSSDVDLNHRLVSLGYKLAWYPKNLVRIIHNPDEKNMAVFDKKDCASCKDIQKTCTSDNLSCYDYYFRINSDFWAEYGSAQHAKVYSASNTPIYCDSFHNNKNLPEQYLSRRLEAMNKFSSLYEKKCAIKNREVRKVYIIDDFFPNSLSLFRYVEFCEFLNKYSNFKVITVGKDAEKYKLELPKEIQAQVIVTDRENLFNPEKFLKIIENKTENAMIYTVTLGMTNNMLQVCESLNIPFVHTLYPGFGFRINDPDITKMLGRLYSSPNFRGVIVTQKCVLDYIKSIFKIDDSLLRFKHGVFAAVSEDTLPKIRYFFDKETLDICFFGHKYLPKGVDKGYDTFVEVAEKLSDHKDIVFHVGGNFDKNDVPYTKANIKFYGSIMLDGIAEWFKDKDILVSPNKSGCYGPGSFDGFPVGSTIEGGLHKCTLLASDPLNNSPGSTNFVIIDSVDSIVNNILYLKNNPNILKEKGDATREEMRLRYATCDLLKPREDLIFSPKT